MTKLEELKNYVSEQLKRVKLTVNDVEVQKAYRFRIKSEKFANLLNLVKCDSITEAAELVCAYCDDKRSGVDYFERKFTEQAKLDNIDLSKPIGIDIIISPSFS